MTSRVKPFTSPVLNVAHGFFSRLGGVSKGVYAELNGGMTTNDLPEAVRENRRLMAEYFGVSENCFLGLKQIHSHRVVVVENQSPYWSSSTPPEADALVTERPDVVLTIATADCAPVLLASDDGKIVGAAHAGWRGAVNGVLEETVMIMRAKGAKNIKAVIGPCIGPSSYEVSSDMKDQLEANHHDGTVFFTPLAQRGKFLFDLPRFCKKRLEVSGVEQIEILPLDTLKDQRFYSYRRATLAGEEATGRQVSAIQACLL